MVFEGKKKALPPFHSHRLSTQTHKPAAGSSIFLSNSFIQRSYRDCHIFVSH